MVCEYIHMCVLLRDFQEKQEKKIVENYVYVMRARLATCHLQQSAQVD